MTVNASPNSYKIYIPEDAELLSCVPDRVFNPSLLVFSFAYTGESFSRTNVAWDVIIKDTYMSNTLIDREFEFFGSVAFNFASLGNPFSITVNGISQTINVPDLTSMQNSAIYQIFVKPPDRNQ